MIVIYKAKAGDKRLIFGRPFTHNGTKWVPDDAKPDSAPDKKEKKPAKEKKPEKKMTAEEATSILKERGIKGIYNLNRDGINNLLKEHGHKPEDMKYEQKFEALKEIVDKLHGKEKVDSSNKEFLPPKIGNINCKGANIRFPVYDKNGAYTGTESSPLSDLKDHISDTAGDKILRGNHWGSANSTNDTAVAFAAINAVEFRPIDKTIDGKLTPTEFNVPLNNCIYAKQMRNYAQKRIKDVDRKENPNIYRGMTLPKDVVESIIAGKTDTIEMTGCTAFTFHTKIMDQYSTSQWTKSFGADKISCKIHLKRDDNVDNSIGMWHDHKTDKDLPAFEMLSGLDAIRIEKIEKPKTATLEDSIKTVEKNRQRIAKNTKKYYDVHNEITDIFKKNDLIHSNNSTIYQGYSLSILSNPDKEDAKQSLLRIANSNPNPNPNVNPNVRTGFYTDYQIKDAKRTLDNFDDIYNGVQSSLKKIDFQNKKNADIISVRRNLIDIIEDKRHEHIKVSIPINKNHVELIKILHDEKTVDENNYLARMVLDIRVDATPEETFNKYNDNPIFNKHKKAILNLLEDVDNYNKSNKDIFTSYDYIDQQKTPVYHFDSQKETGKSYIFHCVAGRSTKKSASDTTADESKE